MSAKNTVGWLHPGYMLQRPYLITSTEHRRRLQHVSDVAEGIIGATLTTACLAGNGGKPTIDPSYDTDRGWRRIGADPDMELSPQGLQVIRRAIGEVSLTQEVCQEVRNGRSPGNEVPDLNTAIQQAITNAAVAARNPEPL